MNKQGKKNANIAKKRISQIFKLYLRYSPICAIRVENALLF